ncbi:MAG UNVERIFIED_CONTAM: hypothetical protein LVR18_14200 [Planctomycetaceae bacterium]
MKSWASGNDHRALRQSCLNLTASADNGGGRHAMRGAGWAWSFVGQGSVYSHNMNPNETACHSNEGDWFGSTMMSASSWHTGGAQICSATVPSSSSARTSTSKPGSKSGFATMDR